MRIPRDWRERNGEDFRKRRKHAMNPDQWERIAAMAERHTIRIDNLIESLIGVGLAMAERQEAGERFYTDRGEPVAEKGGELVRIVAIEFPDRTP